MEKIKRSMLNELLVLAHIDDGIIHFQSLHLFVTARMPYFLRDTSYDRTDPCSGCGQREVECIWAVSLFEDGLEGAAEHTDAHFQFG